MSSTDTLLEQDLGDHCILVCLLSDPRNIGHGVVDTFDIDLVLEGDGQAAALSATGLQSLCTDIIRT